MSKVPQSRRAIERGIDMDEAARLYFPRPSKVFGGFCNLDNTPQLGGTMQSMGVSSPTQRRDDIYRAAQSVFRPRP